MKIGDSPSNIIYIFIMYVNSNGLAREMFVSEYLIYLNKLFIEKNGKTF